jgi:hypothetical protein
VSVSIRSRELVGENSEVFEEGTSFSLRLGLLGGGSSLNKVEGGGWRVEGRKRPDTLMAIHL